MIIAKDQEEIGNDYLRGLKELLRTQWQCGNISACYGILTDLQPYIYRGICFKYHQLNYADVEDCISAAYVAFLSVVERNASISDPYNYFFKIVENKANDHLRRPENGQATFDDDQLFITQDTVSELIGVAEPEPHWGAALKEAIERLSPKLREVMHYLIENGLDTRSNQAGKDLNLDAAAFRMAKKRALRRLRDIFPEVVNEWGIEPPQQLEPTIFHERPNEFPSED